MWVIDVHGYGVTQAERISDIDAMVCDYVGCMDDIEPAHVTVETVIELPAEVREAQRATADAAQATTAAAAKTRAAVRALKASGWQNKEIAAALEVTEGRVSQLTRDPGKPPAQSRHKRPRAVG
jgi:DNA-directed RNA polymerase specialized sigma24 family protein